MKWLKALLSPPDARTPHHKHIGEALKKRLKTQPILTEWAHPRDEPGPIYTLYRLEHEAHGSRRTLEVNLRNSSATVTFNGAAALTIRYEDTPADQSLAQILTTIDLIRTDRLVLLRRQFRTGEPYGRPAVDECVPIESAAELAQRHCAQPFDREENFATITSWSGERDHQVDPPRPHNVTPPPS